MSSVTFSLALLVVQLFGFGSGAHELPAEQQPIQDEGYSFAKVRAELKKAEIIPTVIDDFLPTLSVSIRWPNASASLGNTLPPSDTHEIPSVSLSSTYVSDSASASAPTNMTYTIALTDPDAPSRDDPKWSEFCHWIATDVPLTSSGASAPSDPQDVSGLSAASQGAALDPNVAEGNPGDVQAAMQTAAVGLKEVMEYKPPGPPPETGKHRYVFLAFAPKNGTSRPLRLSKPESRKHWGYEGERMGVRLWAEENGLEPVGANFIYAQNEKQC